MDSKFRKIFFGSLLRIFGKIWLRRIWNFIIIYILCIALILGLRIIFFFLFLLLLRWNLIFFFFWLFFFFLYIIYFFFWFFFNVLDIVFFLFFFFMTTFSSTLGLGSTFFGFGGALIWVKSVSFSLFLVPPFL